MANAIQRFRVKYNLEVCQPRWSGDYPRIFGPRNEGIPVIADSPQEAVKAVAAQVVFNPFYLKAVPDNS